MNAKILAMLLAAGAAAAPASAQPQQTAQAQTDSAALHAIESAVQQALLETEFTAQFRAGKRITHFADYSLAPVREQAAQQARWKDALAKIDPARLSEDERRSYGILQFELSGIARDEAEYWLTFDLTSYQSPMAIGTAHQIMAAHALATPADAAEYIRLVEAYATMLGTLGAKLEAQTARGIYMPKAALPVARKTLTSLADAAAALRPADARLSGLDAATRGKLLAAVDATLDGKIRPAYARLGALVGADYEAKAPEAVGIGQYPGGKTVYQKLIHRYTTMEMTPEQLHQQGLAAVADVSARMQAIRTQLGFTGTSRAFYDKISTDPRFLAKTPADVEATYDRYIKAIEPKVADYFRVVPKAPYGAKRLPAASEAGQTFGYYSPPTPAEPRGIYYYNGSNLEKRSLINAGTLIYHELVPGHHFQIALQQENKALSPFRQNYYAGAFNEGWGEYAASLGIPLGLYDTPEALYGRYVNEMFLTIRLVVDTGMNHFGWSLEKARAYMREVSSLSDMEIDSESLRYSTSIPGQALSYRTGYDKMWSLRRHAEERLGAAFDVRDFHDVVLLPGTRPMPVLEADINAYIASKRP
ncbi:DUF885 domain-containing protein [Sphingosinicella soli]|uniref:Uncharacterized protein (DUF885 family) n=1 Tax=Sphingosinicella soli TaxID=333708 RepID=A0A7W7B4B1_9SPHN|nr:DUF885 domain-containing protein [Sphingosinicella soli]MBB4633700.1 uncharacterized protein (DUF885 family) [Sphingosinicella soli]